MHLFAALRSKGVGLFALCPRMLTVALMSGRVWRAMCNKLPTSSRNLLYVSSFTSSRFLVEFESSGVAGVDAFNFG